MKLFLELQAGDGGFYSEGDSLGPRPFVYDVPLLASIYALLALSRSRRALRAYTCASRAVSSRPGLRLPHDALALRRGEASPLVGRLARLSGSSPS